MIHINSAKAAGLRSAVKTAGPGCEPHCSVNNAAMPILAFLSSVSLFDVDLYVFFLFNHIRPELMLFVPAAFDALSQCPFSHQPITAVLSRILVPKSKPCRSLPMPNHRAEYGIIHRTLLCKSCHRCKCRSTLGDTPDNSCFCM